MEDVNVDVNPELLYVQYQQPEVEFPIGQAFGGVAITSINGISGPSVTFAGGVSGFSFAPGGTTITLVSPLTVKGDLYTRNSTTGVALAVGTNGFVLSADSGEATGLKWIANATGTVTNTGTLTANQLILGNGGVDVAALGSLGTTSTVLHGNAGGAPAFTAVSLTTDVAGILPIANGGTNDTGTAWTAYTPTVTASSGTFTSVAATGRYKTLGKTVWLQLSVAITTNGSAAGVVLATAPSTAAAFDYPLAGQETTAAGFGLTGRVVGSSTQIQINKYDATYPGADGRTLVMCGVYEQA